MPRAMDNARIPGRKEPGRPVAPRSRRHRHRSPQSGGHRAGGRDAASADAWTRDPRNRHGRTRGQRALRGRLVQTRRSVHRGASDDPRAVGLRRRAGVTRLAVLPTAQRVLHPAAVQRQMAGDLDRIARPANVEGDWPICRRLVSGGLVPAPRLQVGARPGARRSVGRRPRSVVDSSRQLVLRRHRTQPRRRRRGARLDRDEGVRAQYPGAGVAAPRRATSDGRRLRRLSGFHPAGARRADGVVVHRRRSRLTDQVVCSDRHTG